MDSIKARFFGRKTILQDLVQGLLAPTQPLDFSLVGPKLIGKSRLLKYLASEQGPLKGSDPFNWRPERFQDGYNIIIGHYDCDWPAAQEHLTQFINRQLKTQLQPNKNLGLDWSSIDDAASPGQQIGQIVHQLHQKQIRLILLLDNFDQILQSDTITPDMVNELRPLTNELGLVVATAQPLHDLNQRLAASPLFNVMHQHFVGLLEPAAASEWLNAYDERFSLAPDLKDILLQMAGGHPFLLARINDIFMEIQPLTPNNDTINQSRLPVIRLRLAEHGRQLFEMNWRKLNEYRDKTVLSLVNQLLESPLPIGQVPSEYGTALNWLINQAMVTYRKNNYHLFSSLYHAFLIEQLGLEQQVAVTGPNYQHIHKQLPPIEADLLRYFQARPNTVIPVINDLTVSKSALAWLSVDPACR